MGILSQLTKITVYMSEVLKIVWTSIHLKDCMSLHKLVLSEQDVYSS